VKEFENMSSITKQDRRFKHRLHNHPLYSRWANMKSRCTNINIRDYQYYGGRGIIVCEEWAVNFQTFHDWAMNHGWKPGLELDRIDNDGNYEPSNCHFITHKKNNRNKRDSHFVEAFGEMKTVTDWCEDDRCKVSRPGLYARIRKGWESEKAIITPPTERNIRRYFRVVQAGQK
jgi:hypothetical protein